MISAALAKAHWRSLVGAFLALALGVLLLSMTMVIASSSTAQPPATVALAQILVSSQPDGATVEGPRQFRPWTQERADALAAAIQELDGVSAAIPDRSFPAQLTVDGRLVTKADAGDRQGHSWSSTALSGARLRDGRPPTSAGEVVVGEQLGLPVGATASLVLATDVRQVVITGVVDGNGIYLDDRSAAAASAGTQVIGVALDDPAVEQAVAEQVRRIVGGDGLVYTGSDRANLEAAADASDRNVAAQLLIMLGGLTAFVSVFVVATTFAFAVSQRRREFGLVRAVGAAAGQVRRLLLAEALVIGLPASTLGALLGTLLAPAMAEWMIANQMQSPGWQPRNVVVPAFAAVATGQVVALAGVWSASRRASRVRPIEALREASVELRPMTATRWVVGVAFTGLSLVLAMLMQGVDFDNVGAITVAAAISGMLGASLLAPVYLPWLIRVICRPLRHRPGATFQLVRESSLTGVRRVASTMGPVLLTVGLAVFITGMVATISDAIHRASSGDLPSTHVVAPAPGSPGVADPVISAAAEHDVPTMSLLRSSVVIDGHWIEGNGLDEGVAALMEQRLVSGELSSFGQDQATVISEQAAIDYGWQPGDRLPMIWPDGSSAVVEVVAVVEGTEPAALFTREQVRGHDPAALAPVVYVNDVDTQRLEAVMRPLGAAVLAASDYQEAGDREEERLIRLFTIAILALAAGYTAMAVANTLAMATADRRRDFAVLRLIGAHDGQVLRVVGLEALIVASIGALIGVLTAVPAVSGIATWIAAELDVTPRLVLDWPVVAGSTAVGLVLASSASLLTAYVALRKPAIHAGRFTE